MLLSRNQWDKQFFAMQASFRSPFFDLRFQDNLIQEN
jgi:hypothetical protein